jgi:predicted Ser/Thr protein kinase
MERGYPIEKIISSDGKVELHIGQLINIYQSLGIERMPSQNLHERNWNSDMAQYTPQVQDPIISFSSSSLVLGLNNEQVCKIIIDKEIDSEIKNIDFIKNKTNLFPEVYFVVDLPIGFKGIIMERIPILNKWNFTSGELNRMYYNFIDDIYKLHTLGIIHNDLGCASDSKIRPNIVLSHNRIRLIDFESIKIKNNTNNWLQLLEHEKKHLTNYFAELIDFACETLT